MIKKFFRTDKRIRLPLCLGILCFVFILIFEIAGSATYGQNIYLYFVAFEEGLEMIAISLFLYFVLVEKKTRIL